MHTIIRKCVRERDSERCELRLGMTGFCCTQTPYIINGIICHDDFGGMAHIRNYYVRRRRQFKCIRIFAIAYS